MLTHRIPRLVTGLVLASALCVPFVHGQTNGEAPSLGEAARRAREQNKGRQPGKVISNEDIGDLKGTVSIVGTQPPVPSATEAAAGAPSTAASTAPKVEVKDETYWRGQFAGARKKLADDSKELDVLQREFSLKEQQFYSNPNVALREQYGRTDLNKTRDEINAKKADVDKDKQAITTLEDSLRQAGGNPGWSRE